MLSGNCASPGRRRYSLRIVMTGSVFPDFHEIPTSLSSAESVGRLERILELFCGLQYGERRRFLVFLFALGKKLDEESADYVRNYLHTSNQQTLLRILVLGHYYSNPKAWQACMELREYHACDTVTRLPSSILAIQPFPVFAFEKDSAAYARLRRLWLKCSSNMCQDVAILENATEFFSRFEPSEALELAVRVVRLDSTRLTSLARLSRRCISCLTRSSECTAKRTAEACALLFSVVEHLVAAEMSPMLVLGLARVSLHCREWPAFQRFNALLLASDTLAGSIEFRACKYYGHILSGMRSYENGDLDGAGKELLRAATSLGSMPVTFFCLNLSLARLLAQRGRCQEVIEYLSLCGVHWAAKQEEVAKWIGLLREGVAPEWEQCYDSWSLF